MKSWKSVLVAVASAGVVCGGGGHAFGQLERVTMEPVAPGVLHQQNFVVDSVHFAALDVPTLLAQDAVNEGAGGMPRFALPEAVDYTPEQFGSIQLLGNGRIAWRLDIHAEGALSLNIGTQYVVPDSLEMYLLDADGRSQWGALTSRDSFRGEMWSPIVPGDVMQIYAEMDEADWDRFAAGFRITSVNIGYRGIGEVLAGHGVDGTRSDACHTDVACEAADPWCQQVKGAACYTISGSGVCSGSMLNNTAEDERPIFYTAFHCGSQTHTSTIRVYFNFQNATCRTPGSTASGGNGTCGPINAGGLPCNTQTIFGSTLIATQQAADSVLLELSSAPPDSYEVVYLGWSVSETPLPPVNGNTWAFGIHHPGVEEKRIAFEYDAYQQGVVSIGSSVNAWFIDYDNGGLEGGSSGSPLFDSHGRVIGAATGVDSFANICDQFQAYGRLEDAYHSNAAFRAALDQVGGGTATSLELHQFFPPTAPESFGFELNSPANGATAQSTGPALDWNGACYTDEYEVLVSTNSDLSNPVVDEMVAPTDTILFIPIQTLDVFTTYYWQVRAFNGVGMTNSPVWSFTTAAPPSPGAFALLTPTNGSTGVETGPVLDWQDSSNAADYLVEVDDSIAFASPVVSQAVTASTIDLADGTLAYDTQYFWRVTARNITGNTLCSQSAWGFRTVAAPPCPCPGDIDGDCDTDVFDFTIFGAHFGQNVTPGTNGDLDGSGFVDVFDFSIFAMDFGCSD